MTNTAVATPDRPSCANCGKPVNAQQVHAYQATETDDLFYCSECTTQHRVVHQPLHRERLARIEKRRGRPMPDPEPPRPTPPHEPPTPDTTRGNQP